MIEDLKSCSNIVLPSPLLIDVCVSVVNAFGNENNSLSSMLVK